MALVRPHTQDPLRHGPAAQRAVLLPEGSLPACRPCLLTPVGVGTARGVPGLQEREDPIPGNPTQLAGKVRRAAPRPQICAPRCMAPQLLAHSRPLQLHNTHSCTQAHPGLVGGPALPTPPTSLAAVLPPSHPTLVSQHTHVHNKPFKRSHMALVPPGHGSPCTQARTGGGRLQPQP
jgi:hypothetical protein